MKLFTIVAVALLIIACSPTGRVTQEEPVQIGGAFILSGIGADWGEAERNGAMLALREFNAEHGTNIEIVVESTTYDNMRTLSAVRKLIDVDHVPVIIGPSWLGGLLSAAAAAEESGVVLITPSESITVIQSEQRYPHSFSTWYRVDEEAKALAQHLREQGFTEVTLFYGNDPFWADFRQKFIAAANEHGLGVASEMTLGPHQQDFKTDLLKLKEKQPQVILFGLDDENAFRQFLKQKQQHLAGVPMYGTELIESFTHNEEYKGLLAGVRFVAPAEPDQQFAQEYKQAYGVPPAFSASTAYDAMNIALSAIAAGNTDGDSIMHYLRGEEFSTVTFGKARFDEMGGLTGGKFVFKQVDAQNNVEVFA